MHSRLEFVFLPKYSPNLNPIEGLWKWLKSDVIHNVFYDKRYKIRTAVSRFMNRINQHPMEVIDRVHPVENVQWKLLYEYAHCLVPQRFAQ
ncbi:hypothetical protein GC101_06195 [Paenibacillus sp. LMG 31459]|uniref:Tc1-like transposase DDE domain-containing protein n=1 Tax=Paenibacillus phytohabitans TaxID=2654978 RepID=A0ABX1YFB0_9BACL|nr:hypothetical protein [Paenibacillus phytohabitans]